MSSAANITTKNISTRTSNLTNMYPDFLKKNSKLFDGNRKRNKTIAKKKKKKTLLPTLTKVQKETYLHRFKYCIPNKLKLGIFGLVYVVVFGYLIITFAFVSNLLNPEPITHFPKNCSVSEIKRSFNTASYKEVTFCTIMTFDNCESYHSKWNYEAGTNTYDDDYVSKKK